MPAGYDADTFRTVTLDRFDMSLGAGLGKLKGRVFRIGHLGDLNDLMLAGTLERRRDGPVRGRRAVHARRCDRGARLYSPVVRGFSPAGTMTRDICLLSAIEMARLVRAKELSARELLAADLDASSSISIRN